MEVEAFSTIYIDPPWNEQGSGKVKRGADRHYPLLKWPDIVRVLYQSGMWNIADDAHLWLWVTANFREDGEKVAHALGFRPVNEVAWIKRRTLDMKDLLTVRQAWQEEGADAALASLRALQERTQIGLGQYLRGAHEVCLLCVRGKGLQVRTEARNIPSVIFAERTKHSTKPEEMRALIESRSHGPRLEMFARKQSPGWTAWGNELEKTQ
jgi:N6-adenosine-specific RNA methylase IME4